jgi:uncharacterized protein
MEKSAIRSVARLLVFIGAVNWGLVGASHFAGSDLNVVSLLVGSFPVVEAIVYILVGLSGLYLVVPGKNS